jgi:hypothetical protein
VHAALTKLLESLRAEPGKRGLVINIDQSVHNKFIIFSDQHKGAKDGADDFMPCENNYLTALDYYSENGFCLVSLGDAEELWENKILSVRRHNKPSFEKEKKFIEVGAFVKIVGNHDIYWTLDPFAPLFLKNIYGYPVKVYDGLLLLKNVNGKLLNIYLTHGHQGDGQSDGNKFSAWFVANIWAPLQSYLQLNPNTPAYDSNLKTLHNSIMYEWAAEQKDLIFISGHTHQPVFGSLTHLEKLYKQLLVARNNKDEKEIARVEEEIQKRKVEYKEVSADYLTMSPTYFNSGCCCFSDGDITGIEISEGYIRLVKWKHNNGVINREVLEEGLLSEISLTV